MPTPPPVVELLAALDRALRVAGYPWYLMGAQAAVVYGSPRMTADVDATIQLGGDDPVHCVDLLRPEGFEPRVSDVAAFAHRTRVLPFVHVATGIPLDLVLAGSGIEAAFMERARPTDIAALSIPVISPEDLVASKILAGRDKDIEDVRGVLREQGLSLRIDLVRAQLSDLERALDRADLVPVLDAAVAEAAGD